MSRFRKLSHTIYECKYHIVFCPKYRYRILKGDIAEYCKTQIYYLCRQKDKIEILELNVQEDHIHYSYLNSAENTQFHLSWVLLKGKLSLKLFERYEKLSKRYWGRHLWSRGYCVSTIGLNEEQIRKYVKWQEKNDKNNEQAQQNIE